MKKIPTLFLRDVAGDMRYVTEEVNSAAAWVLDGEGVATAKYDGTCVMRDSEGRWWARREVKPGGNQPQGYVEIDHDPVTGKTQGWEPAEQSPWRKILCANDFGTALTAGTYELVGPKVNGNPHRLEYHQVIAHRLAERLDVPRLTFAGIREAVLAANERTIEGIVWHHPDGRMAKIKARDFPHFRPDKAGGQR